MTSFARICFALTSTLVLFAAAACSSGKSGRAIADDTSTTLTPCEPLTSQAIPLPTPLIGIGKDKQGTLYVAAGTNAGEGTPRVFVLESGDLQEQNVIGASIKGSGTDASYNLGFVAAGAAYSTARNLLVAVSAGKTTAMALGAPTTKGVIGDPSEANDELLALQGADAITGLAARGLPLSAEHIGRLADGTMVVVLRAADSLRLFYGAPNTLYERKIIDTGGEASDEGISFDVGGDTYVSDYRYARSKSGEGGTNGMGDSSTWTLVTPSGTLPVAITFAASALSGATFECLSP